jgi:HD-like signal output (HDOD) protein
MVGQAPGAIKAPPLRDLRNAGVLPGRGVQGSGDPAILERRSIELFDILLQMLEARLPFLRGRVDRIGAVADLLARRVGLDSAHRLCLALSSRYHDLGLLGIPDTILLKSGKLEPAELALIRRHTDCGGRMLAKLLPHRPDVAEAIFYHHERADGSGFYGLTGDTMPLNAAILCLAEAVEAMANDRPHRTGLKPALLVSEVQRNSGTQFAGNVVEAFLQDSAQIYEVASKAAPGNCAAMVTVPTSQKEEVPPPALPGKPPAPPRSQSQVPSVFRKSPVTCAQPAVPLVEKSSWALKLPSSPPQFIVKLLTAEQCQHRIEKAFQDKAPSPAVSRVLGLAASPRADLNELIGVISTDPVLSARVIQMANSAALSSVRKLVTTVQEAVRKIGCAGVRNIALTLGIFEAMPVSSSEVFDVIGYWQHCLAVARLCEKFCAKEDAAIAATAYLVGLCHELGSMLFYSHFGKEYIQIQKVHGKTGIPMGELEKEMLGTTQRELMSLAMGSIGLPEMVRLPIQAFHSWGVRGSSSCQLAAVLRVADLMANALMLGTSPASPVAPLTMAEYRQALGNEPPPSIDADRFRGDIICSTVTVARLSDGEQRRLIERLTPRRTLPLWFVRDAALSSLDPITTSLESLADVTVTSRMPSPAELANQQALVICTPDPDGELGVVALTKLKQGLGATVPRLLLTRSSKVQSVRVLQGVLVAGWPLSLETLREFVASGRSSQE